MWRLQVVATWRFTGAATPKSAEAARQALVAALQKGCDRALLTCPRDYLESHVCRVDGWIDAKKTEGGQRRDGGCAGHERRRVGRPGEMEGRQTRRDGGWAGHERRRMAGIRQS